MIKLTAKNNTGHLSFDIADNSEGIIVASAKLSLQAKKAEFTAISALDSTYQKPLLQSLFAEFGKDINNLLKSKQGKSLSGIPKEMKVNLVKDAGYLTGFQTFLALNVDAIDKESLLQFDLFLSLCLASGLDEKAALLSGLSYFESLEEKEQGILLKELQQPEVDPGNTMGTFLSQGKNQELHEKQRLISWFRLRNLVQIPYNTDNVSKDIAQYNDLASLRTAIQKDISDSFNESIDKENAIKVSDWCREQDIRLVCGRFSRAFYIDGMLMGSAKLIPSAFITKTIQSLSKEIISKDAQFSLLRYLGSDDQSLQNLLGKEWISKAEVEGITRRFRKSLQKFEKESTQNAEKKFLHDWKSLSAKLEGIHKAAQAIREKLADLDKCLSEAPKKDPAFLVFFQRITNTGAINIGIFNEKKDPFFGEDDEIHELIRESGHHSYITPHLNTWLKKCDDWIEALPAYASYQITPQEKGGYKISAAVQRASLEEMYRRHADDWADNIEEVMHLEEMELARELILNSFASDKAKINHASKCDFIKKQELEKAIANLSALISESAWNLAESIAIQQEAGFKRLEAINTVLNQNSSPHNLAKPFMAKAIKAASIKKMESLVAEHHLEDKAASFLPMVYRKPRPLPCAHVLTTLGPGETEVNVENWLEESMALYNVIRHHHLENEVKTRIKEYSSVITEATREVVKQQELEGTLLNLLNDENLDSNDPADYSKGLLKLVMSYPEICADVAKFMGISSRDLYRKMDRTNSIVLARREIIAEKELSVELANPRYRYEAAGPCKRYNLLYTPSRVDLGIDEVYSVQGIPKWLGGKDKEASVRGKELYALYNANPQAVSSPRLAEFMKVGENFFTRGGVFYLSLAAGANIDALRIGDFEFFRDQWNMREDRLVLPTGETYGGFCVPKEFTLLYAVTLAAVDPVTSNTLLTTFGIPKEIQPLLVNDLRKLLRLKLDATTQMDWEIKVQEFLSERYQEYFQTNGGCFYLPNMVNLSNLFEKSGIMAPANEEKIHETYELTNWINKKAQGLEEINRVGPYRKIHLIRSLIQKAREKNPAIAPDEKLIGVMTASYKEGAVKDGMEIPITDVRFSAGARKLEIFSGVHEQHILKDIDPEGREVIKKMFAGFKSVADIRFVGTCTGSDLLNYVPRSGLEDIKEEVNNILLDTGLNQSMIDANCKVYGGDLENWSGIKEMEPEKKKSLLDKIGARIHLLVTDRRGTFATYEEAIQGTDFLDLGVPDPELLDLLDNMPKLFYLMRKGRTNSAMVLADGTSGARRRTFSFRYPSSRRKIKELYALEPEVQYGSLGLGEETIRQWRQEMETERDLTLRIMDGLKKKDNSASDTALARLHQEALLGEKAEIEAVDEKKARDNGVWNEDYRYLSRAYGKLKTGLSLNEMDFGLWLLLGGIYSLNGKATLEQLANLRSEYETLQKKQKGYSPYFNSREIDAIISSFFKPVYQPELLDEYQEMKTGIGGSLKAVEEKVARLEKLNERRRMTRKILGLRQRKEAYAKLMSRDNSNLSSLNMNQLYEKALSVLQVNALNNQDQMGQFQAMQAILSRVFISNAHANTLFTNESCDKFEQLITQELQGNEITPELYKEYSRGMEKLAEETDSRQTKEELAILMELWDITFLLEKMLSVETPHDRMLETARFFDLTLNNHIFDYIPYHYHAERGIGFKAYNREDIFKLSQSRHQWLYRHLHYILTETTELKETSSQYRDLWIGNILEGKVPMGVNVDTPWEQFWFSYTRLRDASVLIHEGIPLPRIIDNLPEKYLKPEKRVNVVIVYPHGNTTVPVALQQGAKLSRQDNVNLMLTVFPRIQEKDKKASLQILDGFMFITRDDFDKISKDSSYNAEMNKNLGDKNEPVLVMARFSQPVAAHALFFHFTHFMRVKIDSLGIPIIQPFLWEAATHLKCRLPEMLKDSGTRTADQGNWYQKNTLGMPTLKAKSQIKKLLLELANKHDTLIVKSEKESGGRSAMILPVRRGKKVISENITTLVNHIYEVSKSDNVVIQEVLKSKVRKLYSQEFLSDMVNRFIKLGLAIQLDREPKTPLFSYFRLIAVRGKEGYRITHRITVVSTQGIANVGQGGLLYEYTDNIINPQYREIFREEIEKCAFKSIDSQKQYLKSHGKEILKDYLEAHPEFSKDVNINLELKNTDLPYEMGDYMPVFLVDNQDNLVRIYDEETGEIHELFEDGKPTRIKLFDKKGKVLTPPYPMFDKAGNRINRYNIKGQLISPLTVFKIEPNPGAGLWRPHNDQLPAERKGEGVYLIFKSLGEIAWEHRNKNS
jgi:hypothetical protein